MLEGGIACTWRQKCRKGQQNSHILSNVCFMHGFARDAVQCAPLRVEGQLDICSVDTMRMPVMDDDYTCTTPLFQLLGQVRRKAVVEQKRGAWRYTSPHSLPFPAVLHPGLVRDPSESRVSARYTVS